MDLVLKTAAALAALLVAMSMVPGPSWPIKIRTLAVALLGMVVLGLWAWPIVAPAEPFGIVSMPDLTGALILMILALATGFVGYFLTWPHGVHMGVIAVPAGMAVWAVRSGVMADKFVGTTGAVQRADFLQSLLPEPFFWLLIAAVGLAGVFLGRFVLAPAAPAQINHNKPRFKLNNPANDAVAVIASAVIAFVAVTLLAQNVKFADDKVGYVTAQPSTGQIGFAVFVAFALASFVTKEFLGAPYFWPAAATALVSAFGLAFYDRSWIMEHMAANWPANFFASPHSSILPIQMVSFGTLGAVAGFWLAQSFEVWRSLQRQPDQ
jgi:uncharacterized membrane protein